MTLWLTSVGYYISSLDDKPLGQNRWIKVVGRGGSVVSSVPYVLRVAGPNPILAAMYGP